MGNLGVLIISMAGIWRISRKLQVKKITVLLGTKYATVFKFRVDGPEFNYRLSRVEDDNIRVFSK